MSVDTVKLICSSVVKLVHKMRRLRFIHFYNASCQRGCPFYVLVPMRHILRNGQRLKINCTSKCYVIHSEFLYLFNEAEKTSNIS
jgi:hypothetical protein